MSLFLRRRFDAFRHSRAALITVGKLVLILRPVVVSGLRRATWLAAVTETTATVPAVSEGSGWRLAQGRRIDRHHLVKLPIINKGM
jgi:hypothetical protein